MICVGKDNSVVNTKLSAILSHRRSTTVSSETYPFTKSWLQVLITLKSMRCRGASFQFMMAGSKSYFPTSIFANARFHIFSRNSIPIVISGDGTSLKILLITLVSNKVQRDAIYRKMESSKLSQYLNPISQLANFLKYSFKF